MAYRSHIGIGGFLVGQVADDICHDLLQFLHQDGVLYVRGWFKTGVPMASMWLGLDSSESLISQGI